MNMTLDRIVRSCTMNVNYCSNDFTLYAVSMDINKCMFTNVHMCVYIYIMSKKCVYCNIYNFIKYICIQFILLNKDIGPFFSYRSQKFLSANIFSMF